MTGSNRHNIVINKILAIVEKYSKTNCLIEVQELCERMYECMNIQEFFATFILSTQNTKST